MAHLQVGQGKITQALVRAFRLRGGLSLGFDRTVTPIAIVEDCVTRANFAAGPREAIGFVDLAAVVATTGVAQLFHDGSSARQENTILRVTRVHFGGGGTTSVEAFVGTAVLGAAKMAEWQDRRFAARSPLGGVRGLNIAGGIGGTQLASWKISTSLSAFWEPSNLLIPAGTGVHFEGDPGDAFGCTIEWDELEMDLV